MYCGTTVKPSRTSLSCGLSPRTVRYIHTILHAALKDALRWNRVVRNVADAATPPSTSAAKAPQTEAWTAEQLRAFLQFTAESRYLPVWLFPATSACRRGEALGLRWSGLDLAAATAVIGHQVTVVENRIVPKELPKTKRGHVIRLDTGTVAMLLAHRKTQNEERLLVGPGFVDKGLVFCRPRFPVPPGPFQPGVQAEPVVLQPDPARASAT